MKKVGRTEPVRVRLLGSPAIQRDGKTAKVDTRKALALLAFLAVERSSHGRASLVALLWPEADETSGRAVLRRTLHALSRVLPAGLLRTEQDQVALGDDPRLWIDVDELREIHARCVGAAGRCPECPLPLRAAVDLCRQDFLAGFTLKDSAAFDDWQFFQAEAFRRLRGSALERLIACLSAADDVDAAIEYASRWLAMDSLDEAPHLALMRLYAQAGRRSAALRQYEACQSITRKELGEEPSPRVKDLAQVIKSGCYPQPSVGTRSDRPSEIGPVPSAGTGQHPATLLALRLVARGARARVARGPPAQEPSAHELAAPGPPASDRPAPEPSAQGTRFLSLLYGLVLRYGGWIEGQVGPTMMVVFGRGSTRESAPELAVRAAIEAREAARLHGVTTAAGISSGLIAIAPGSETASRAESLSGSVVAEARRLAAGARGGEILVGESTFRSTRAVARYHEVREPGGKPACHRLGVLLEEPRKTRGIEGLGGRLVGRDEELAKLRLGLQEVLRGGQRLVTVIGGVGVGKSRLVAEGRAAVRRQGEESLLWLEGRCLDIGVGVSYWPFIDILKHFFTWRLEDTDQTHAEHIGQALAGLEARGFLQPGRREATARHLYLLLSAADPDAVSRDPISRDQISDDPISRDHVSHDHVSHDHVSRDHVSRDHVSRDHVSRDHVSHDPEAGRAGIFEAVRDLVEAIARSRPLVLVFEDLHWADALTLDLIGFLMDTLGAPGPGAVPALGLVCVYRPMQDHRCRHIPALASAKCPQRYTEIHLRDLTPEESAELVEALLGTHGLPQSLNRAILDRSQGNPFFLEEIVRSLIDTGVLYRGRGRWRARPERAASGVPQSVESVIRGTTDRLPPAALGVLRAAAVLGRVFDASVLQGMIPRAGAEAQLRLLEDQGLVYEERTVPRQEFSFRHVLTREAVYAGIPEMERRELHELAARIILEISGDRPGPYLERLAFHYEGAGLQEQAVRYLHQAARKAIRASDNQAAIGLLERALAMVSCWPPGAQRDASELDIRLTLGVPVTATTGYGSLETRRVYQRAVELCRPNERSASAFAAAYGLWRFHTMRGELGPSQRLNERLTELSRDLDDDIMPLEARRALAVTLMHSGRIREAGAVLEAGIEAYDPARHRSNAFIYGHDPATTFYCYRALGLWLEGCPDRAAASIDRLWDLLRDSSHRLSLTYACSIGAQVFQLRGDPGRVRWMSTRGVALAAEGRLPMFGGFAQIMQGWATMMSGEVALGVEGIREGVRRWDGTSGGSFRPYVRSLLAEATRRAGDPSGAARILHDTTRELESGRCDRIFEPELYRLLAEIHMDAGDLAPAESLLRTAAVRAQAAGACSLQLRAAMSLARYHALRGEPRAGRQLVRDAAGLIHEGWETADLREAARLVQGLD